MCTVLFFGLYALWPAKVSAENAKTIAVYADQSARGLREAVIKALPAGFDVVDDKRFLAALAGAGQGTFRGKVDEQVIKRVRVAGVAVGADLVLLARVRTEATSRIVRILILEVAASDMPAVQTVPVGLQPSASDEPRIAAAVRALDRYAPAAAPAPAPEPEPAPAEPEPPPVVPPPPSVIVPPVGPAAPESPPPPAPRTKAQLMATCFIDLALGGEAFGRHYEFHNGIAPSPYVHRLPMAPGARATASIFPFASRGSPWGDLGVAFEYARAFLQSADHDGAPQGSAPSSYWLALRARFRPGSATIPPVILNASVGYAFSSFGLVGPANAELPDVTYRAIRPAFDVRVPLGSFSILGSAAFRALIQTGSISTRLPDPSGFGFDAELGGAFMFVRHLELRLAARYEHYALEFTLPSRQAFGPVRTTDQRYSARASIGVIF